MRAESSVSASYRAQFTHAPNGSFCGIPSSNTSDLEAAVAPVLRKLTPAEVGLPKIADCRR